MQPTSYIAFTTMHEYLKYANSNFFVGCFPAFLYKKKNEMLVQRIIPMANLGSISIPLQRGIP